MKSVRDIFSLLPRDGFGLISCDELSDRYSQEGSPFLLDIRKRADWIGKRIPGSVHSEWENVGDLVESGGLPSDRDIVVICYVGQSSGQVTGILRSLGYPAYSLLNGFNEWMDSGYPVEKGQ